MCQFLYCGSFILHFSSINTLFSFLHFIPFFKFFYPKIFYSFLFLSISYSSHFDALACCLQNVSVANVRLEIICLIFVKMGCVTKNANSNKCPCLVLVPGNHLKRSMLRTILYILVLSCTHSTCNVEGTKVPKDFPPLVHPNGLGDGIGGFIWLSPIKIVCAGFGMLSCQFLPYSLFPFWDFSEMYL